MNFKDFFEGEGSVGTVVYDEYNDCYELDVGGFNIGLQSNGWDEFEGKRIKIIVEVLKQDGTKR